MANQDPLRRIAELQQAGKTDDEIFAILDREAGVAPASVPPAAPDTRGKLRKAWDNGVRPALQGATLGFSDELRGVGSALTGGSYAEGRDKERAALERASIEAPGLSGVAEFAGSMLAPGAVFGKAIKGVGYGAKALRGLAVGAGSGMVHGAGKSRLDEDGAAGIVQRTLGEGVLGAVTGGVAGSAPAVGRAIGITTKGNRAMSGRGLLREALTRTGRSVDDVYARAGNGAGNVLESLGPAGPEVLREMGPVSAATAGRLFQASEQTTGPLSAALRRASQNIEPGFTRPVLPSKIGIGASIVTKGLQRSARKEADDLADELLQQVDDDVLGRLFPKSGRTIPVAPAARAAEEIQEQAAAPVRRAPSPVVTPEPTVAAPSKTLAEAIEKKSKASPDNFKKAVTDPDLVPEGLQVKQAEVPRNARAENTYRGLPAEHRPDLGGKSFDEYFDSLSPDGQRRLTADLYKKAGQLKSSTRQQALEFLREKLHRSQPEEWEIQEAMKTIQQHHKAP